MQLTELNAHLEKLHQRAIDFLATKHNSKTILREDLRSYLDALKVDEQKEHLVKLEKELELKKQKIAKENDFFVTWQKIIDITKTTEGLPISEGTKRSKNQTLNLVKEHCAKNNIKLTFESLDKGYYNELDNYMIEKGLLPNSRGSTLKI